MRGYGSTPSQSTTVSTLQFWICFHLLRLKSCFFWPASTRKIEWGWEEDPTRNGNSFFVVREYTKPREGFIQTGGGDNCMKNVLQTLKNLQFNLNNFSRRNFKGTKKWNRLLWTRQP
jgi:hypothetical protein